MADPQLTAAEVRLMRELQGSDPGAVSSLCTDGANGPDDPAWHGDCPGCGCVCHGDFLLGVPGEAPRAPAAHEDLLDEMALAADLAAVDTAYEVMREHGLKTLADRERDGESGTGDAVGNVPGSAGLVGGPARGRRIDG